nr:MAG TPA: hypothetical protein [Caudoviricetes sp.]
MCLSWRWRNAPTVIQKAHQAVTELEKTTKQP